MNGEAMGEDGNDDKEEGQEKPEAMAVDTSPKKPDQEVDVNGEVKPGEGPAETGPEKGSLQGEKAEIEQVPLLRQLDLQLTYLWNVHYIDYYAGAWRFWAALNRWLCGCSSLFSVVVVIAIVRCTLA